MAGLAMPNTQYQIPKFKTIQKAQETADRDHNAIHICGLVCPKTALT